VLFDGFCDYFFSYTLLVLKLKLDMLLESAPGWFPHSRDERLCLRDASQGRSLRWGGTGGLAAWVAVPDMRAESRAGSPCHGDVPSVADFA